MTGTKHLILGFCARQPFRLLEPFIASLRHSGFAGDVCLLIEDMAADTIAQLRAHGVMVERTAQSAQPRISRMASRFFSCLDYLLHHADEYARVLLTDPTEVVFQSNPLLVPLPADIVYTSERRRIGESAADHAAVVQAYGETVAYNIRDCTAANASLTIGTLPGMLRYLFAMTHELGGRTDPVSGAIDRGIHNFVATMRPQRFALLDTTDQFAVACQSVADDAVQIAGQAVIAGGRQPPILSRWRDNATIREHVHASPWFRLDASMRGAFPIAHYQPPPVRGLASGGDAVITFYHRERDTEWLPLFLDSLRCVTSNVQLHCVGEFDEAAQRVLSAANATLHPVAPTQLDVAENAAHFYVSQVLDLLAADEAHRPAQVLSIDNMRACFVRDPFASKTVGLSAFCEGPGRIADSEYNRARLGLFVPEHATGVPAPIVSSAILRGPLPAMHDFYRAMLGEMIGRPDLLTTTKSVQGAINKLCYLGRLAFPVIIHPNGAEVYFDHWESGLPIDIRHGVRVGGTVPSVVLGSHPETQLMLRLRTDLSLSRH